MSINRMGRLQPDRRALGVARGQCQADRPAKAGASPHKQAPVGSPRRGATPTPALARKTRVHGLACGFPKAYRASFRGSRAVKSARRCLAFMPLPRPVHLGGWERLTTEPFTPSSADDYQAPDVFAQMPAS